MEEPLNEQLGQAAAADARNGTDWSDVRFIHATRWQDEPLAQVGSGASGYPNPNRPKAWEIWRDRGAHVSIAVLIEMQMRHGMPPFQLALDHGILLKAQPGRQHQNDHGSVFADARRLHAAARAGQRSAISGGTTRDDKRCCTVVDFAI